jgi:hypothetical protein
MTEALSVRAALVAMEGGSIACLVDCAAIRDITDGERASFSMEFSHFEQKR